MNRSEHKREGAVQHVHTKTRPETAVILLQWLDDSSILSLKLQWVKPPGLQGSTLFSLNLPPIFRGICSKIKRFSFSFIHVHIWQFHFLKVTIKCGMMASFHACTISKTHSEKLKYLLHLDWSFQRQWKLIAKPYPIYICLDETLKRKAGPLIFVSTLHT